MPEDTSQKEIATIAALMLLWKIQLEEKFKPELGTFFNKLSKDIFAVYFASGSILNLNAYYPELVTLLRTQYRRIANKFDAEFVSRIKDPALKASIENSLNVNHNIVDYINTQSEKQAQYILDTTRRELNHITANIIVNNTQTGVSLTNAQIAKNIQNEFKKRTKDRIDTIAMTETQITSEKVKLIEAQEVALAIDELPIVPKVIKTWSSTLDNKTRVAHADADTQTQPINKPFEVKGQLLMTPGDDSLGATMDNIINCRCSSVATIEY